MSGVPLFCMPDIFSCKEVKQQGLRGCAGVPASGSFQPWAGGTVQAKRTIFFGGKVNVCHCGEFQSCSIVKVCHSEKFLVMF